MPGFTPLGAAIHQPDGSDVWSWGRVLALSANGTRAVVSGTHHDPERYASGGDKSAPAVVFEWDGAEWRQLGDGLERATSGEAGHGTAISADGSRVILGDVAYDNWRGRARVYEYDPATGWTQLVQWAGESQSIYTARSVGMNADGTVVAVGGTHTSTNNSHGRVRVYRENAQGQWDLLDEINDDSGYNRYMHFGINTSLSADGLRIATAALGMWDPGYVQVHQYDEAQSKFVLMDGSKQAGQQFGDIRLSADGNTCVFRSDGTDARTVLQWNGSSWVSGGHHASGRLHLGGTSKSNSVTRSTRTARASPSAARSTTAPLMDTPAAGASRCTTGMVPSGPSPPCKTSRTRTWALASTRR